MGDQSVQSPEPRRFEGRSHREYDGHSPNEEEEDRGDFIFHLPVGMVDFNDSMEMASGPQPEADPALELKEEIVKNVWAQSNAVPNDNPYSLQNYHYPDPNTGATVATST